VGRGYTGHSRRHQLLLYDSDKQSVGLDDLHCRGVTISCTPSLANHINRPPPAEAGREAGRPVTASVSRWLRPSSSQWITRPLSSSQLVVLL